MLGDPFSAALGPHLISHEGSPFADASGSAVTFGGLTRRYI